MPRPPENALVVPADGTPEELVATIIHRLDIPAGTGG